MVQPGQALFLADTRGLDFLNSIAAPAGTEIDWIADGDGLLAWLEQARLVPPAALVPLREQARPGELDEVAARARSLREEFRAFVREYKGRPLTPADLDREEVTALNRLLARDEGFLQLVPAGPGDPSALRLRPVRRWGAPDSLLLPVGEALARLLGEEDFSDVKSCQGPGCTLMFVDRTRGRVRRWCSMAICGNRAKQAAHRSRARRVRDAGSDA